MRSGTEDDGRHGGDMVAEGEGKRRAEKAFLKENIREFMSSRIYTNIPVLIREKQYVRE